MRSPDLSYQSIGVRTGSVQARYANRLADKLPDLDTALFHSLDEVFAAVVSGAVAGAILEANVANP